MKQLVLANTVLRVLGKTVALGGGVASAALGVAFLFAGMPDKGFCGFAIAATLFATR